MDVGTRVTEHYGGRGDITATITDGLAASGVDLGAVQPDDLAGVDEFHLGGRAATMAAIDELTIDGDDEVIDVGCGVGGPARAIATATGCTVLGIDLTEEFVVTARDLSALVGLDHATVFDVASATDLPFDDDRFAAATMFHVGMNLPDKRGAFAEMARVVRPGGAVVVYDIMSTGDGEPSFPVPWAADPSTSFVESPEAYRGALRSVGLDPGPAIDRTGLVMEVMARSAAAPPALNLGHLMGPRFPEMFGNLFAAVNDGVVAPISITARAPADA